MSNVDPQQDPGDQPDPLAAAAAREAELTERLAAVERNAALTSVIGAAAATPLGQVFARGYDGELSPEKITEAATAIGLLQTPGAGDSGEAAPDAGDAAASDERSELRSGATPPGREPTPDPREVAAEAGRAAWKQGTTDEALGVHFGSLIDAAARGDQRVIIDYFNPNTHGQSRR